MNIRYENCRVGTAPIWSHPPHQTGRAVLPHPAFRSDSPIHYRVRQTSSVSSLYIVRVFVEASELLDELISVYCVLPQLHTRAVQIPIRVYHNER